MAPNVFGNTDSILNRERQVQINYAEAASGNDRHGYWRMTVYVSQKVMISVILMNDIRENLEQLLKPSLLLTRWEIGWHAARLQPESAESSRG